MAKFRVLTGFVHADGNAVEPGDTVEFNLGDKTEKSTAEHYVNVGRIVEWKGAEKSKDDK